MPPMTLNRRDFLRTLAGATAFASAGKLSRAASRTTKPNIVFILADDLGYADVSCYGRPDLKTPAIDSIAANGVQLMQAYANSAVCSATRTALITGRYQYRLPIGLEEPLAGRQDVGLPPEHPTLPSLLRVTGYSTALIGKWHLGVLPKFGPLQSGYDHFFGFRNGAVDYYTHVGQDTGGQPDLWDGDTKVDTHGYLTELLGKRAVESIDTFSRSKRPFLLSLHFSAPHWPWEIPGDETESQRLAKQGKGLFDIDGGTQATYRKMIEAMDEQVGHVLEALRKNSLLENTIVIFTSDNGGERFADTWPFTGKKTELLEGGLRIPALMQWPARIPKGKTSNQVAITMDWLPTLLSAAGTAPDPNYPSDGIDLLPYLADRKPAVRRTLFWRYKAHAQRAVRDGDMKFLKMLDNTFLFNVVEDPLERANLKDREKQTFDRLRHAWFEWNKTMLPETKESFTHGMNGRNLADHYGLKPPTGDPDNPLGPDD